LLLLLDAGEQILEAFDSLALALGLAVALSFVDERSNARPTALVGAVGLDAGRSGS
jgi:hypothetical protein